MKFPLFVAAGLWTFSAVAVPVADLQTFEGCKLVPSEWADGDSFLVELAPGRTEALRLYFVDCPETSATTETDQRRVREQSSYFGMDNHRTTMEFGRKAADEVRNWLGKPFTVHTVFSRALGRSAKPRIYAFVTLSDGRDLGEVLVAAGLARSHGVGRTTKQGVGTDETKEHLDDVELGAAIGRKGVWGKTNPDKLVAMREERRKEERQLKEDFGLGAGEKVDANKATVDEIVLLPGVGEVLAERIVDGRPYASVDDLRRVPGLGGKVFDRLRDRLVVTH